MFVKLYAGSISIIVKKIVNLIHTCIKIYIHTNNMFNYMHSLLHIHIHLHLYIYIHYWHIYTQLLHFLLGSPTPPQGMRLTVFRRQLWDSQDHSVEAQSWNHLGFFNDICKYTWAMNKNPGWLEVFLGDYIYYPNYVGIIFHKPWHKDPNLNQPGFSMESRGPRVFWNVAHFLHWAKWPKSVKPVDIWFIGTRSSIFWRKGYPPWN